MDLRARKKGYFLFISSIIVGLQVPHVNASGFAISEGNISGLGVAYAGKSAVADDVSTMFYNPAGLSHVKNYQFVGSAAGIFPHLNGSVNAATTVVGTPLLTGNMSDNAGKRAAIPAVYWGGPSNDKWSWGVGITAPFGLVTEYDGNSQFRYLATRSEIRTVDINPTVSYLINDQWSLGGGISFQSIEAQLNRKIDGAGVCLAAKARIPSLPCTPYTTPGQLSADAEVKNYATGWGIGFDAGVLFQYTPKTRFGLGYRSHIKQNVTGTTTFDLSALLQGLNSIPAVNALLNFNTQGVSSTVTLPEIVSLSGYHEYSDTWTLMADVSFTRWSRFQELRLKFGGGLPDAVTNENFKDTWRYALGAIHKCSEHWWFKGGVAYDQTPVQDLYRTARLPDNDRLWLAIGAKYRVNNQWDIDMGYSHLFMRDTSIQERSDASNAYPSLNANYQSKIDIVGVQLTWNLV